MTKLLYGHVNVNGVKIHYYRTVDDKPALVLLHGYCDNGLCWNNLALSLKNSYDVVMIDARGHGLSDAPESDYSYEDQAYDASQVIQSLMLEKPVVIGHSMGARSAVTLAANFPHLVRGIILEDPPFRDDFSETTIEARAIMSEKSRQQISEYKRITFDELVTRNKLVNPKWSEEEHFHWAKAKNQVSLNVIHLFSAPSIPWREQVKKVRCPALVITGDVECGAIITPQIAKELSCLRNWITVHIPDAGHSIRRDQFEDYLKVVKDFLKDHPVR